MTADEIVRLIISNPHLGLAKAITAIESTNSKNRNVGRDVVNLIYLQRKESLRIGISGVPGVGKSTFIEVFGLYLISQGKTVAVLTIDPSSPVSGGSILGDKTRMANLANHPKAFIRPSPANGQLGGVALGTRESIYLCEFAKYDIVIVETVGVGQSEIAVKSMTDLFIQLHIPNSGDELQGMKKGILEVADLIVVTKADGETLRAAEIAQTELQQALAINPSRGKPAPEVFLASSTEGTGIKEIWNHLNTTINARLKFNEFHRNRSRQQVDWFEQELDSQIKQFLNQQPSFQSKYKEYLIQVQANQITPIEASNKLIKILLK